jgi:hypothetical protein
VFSVYDTASTVVRTNGMGADGSTVTIVLTCAFVSIVAVRSISVETFITFALVWMCCIVTVCVAITFIITRIAFVHILDFMVEVWINT